MTTSTADELEKSEQYPGASLKDAREKRDYSQEYVAGRLHLRARVVALLEADDYDQLPEPVFVKGYIRAYAKLLDLDDVPLIEQYKQYAKNIQKPDRALWQSQREVNTGAHLLRWFTLVSLMLIMIVVGLWWHKSKDSSESGKKSPVEISAASPSKKITLTDLSNMHTVVELPEKAVKSG